MSKDEIKTYYVKFKIASLGTLPTVNSINKMETQDIIFEITCIDQIISPYSVTVI